MPAHDANPPVALASYPPSDRHTSSPQSPTTTATPPPRPHAPTSLRPSPQQGTPAGYEKTPNQATTTTIPASAATPITLSGRAALARVHHYPAPPPTSDAPRHINPDVTVSRDDLTPGRVIWRHTRPTPTGTLAPLPCHEQQIVRLHPTTEAVAICRACSTAYSVELVDDLDEGHWAAFVLSGTPYLLSRTRWGSTRDAHPCP